MSGFDPRNDVPEYLEKYRSSMESLGWTPEGVAADYSVGMRVPPTGMRA